MAANDDGNMLVKEPIPANVWAQRWVAWTGELEQFMRTKAEGGTCMEPSYDSRREAREFFGTMSIMYWDLQGPNPAAIVSLPAAGTHGSRIVTDDDRMFTEGERPVSSYTGSAAGLWIPLAGTPTLPKIRGRVERNVERMKAETERNETELRERGLSSREVERAVARSARNGSRYERWLRAND